MGNVDTEDTELGLRHLQAKGCGLHQTLGGRQVADFPSEPQGEQPSRHLASELWESKFLLFYATQLVVICYHSFRKLIQVGSHTVLKMFEMVAYN